MSGDPNGAMDQLAKSALICGNEDATAELTEAYIRANGSDQGLDDWSCRKRLEVAKTADDFELPSLDGTRHRFADLRGTVTLLNFWSPT